MANILHPNILRPQEKRSPHVKTLGAWLADVGGLMILFQSRGIGDFYFLADDVKFLFLTLVRFVYEMRRLGYKLDPSCIDLENLVVLYGIIKFKEVKGSKLAESDRGIEDFTALAYFFEFDVLRMYQRAIFPADLTSFLDLLKRDPIFDEVLIKYHYAMMWEPRRIEFLRACYQECDKFDDSHLNVISAFGELDPENRWESEIRSYTRSPLHEIYTKCVTDGVFRSTRVDVIKFIRHALVHLKSPLEARVMLLTSALPKIVPRLGEALYKFNLITLSKLSSYFPETTS